MTNNQETFNYVVVRRPATSQSCPYCGLWLESDQLAIRISNLVVHPQCYIKKLELGILKHWNTIKEISSIDGLNVTQTLYVETDPDQEI